jgi:hypothetical protein
MTEAKPVAQQVEEETTTKDEVKSNEQSNDWFDALPWTVKAPLKALGLDDDLEGVISYLENSPLGQGAEDVIADLKQITRDLKDDLIGPDAISFTVQPKAITGDNDRNDAHNSSLRYPNDSILGSTDYMLFQFFRYQPPFGGQGIQANLTGEGTGEYDSLSEYNRSTSALKVDTQLNQVVLYVPPDVTSTYGAEWSDQSFSNTAVAKIRGGMALRDGNVVASLQGQIENGLNAAGRMPEIGGADFIRNQIASATGEQLSRNDLFSSAAGVVLNPNTELLFRNPQMRTIDFTYKLVPNNQAEAEIIFEIVRTFKMCLHSSFGIPGKQQGAKAKGLVAPLNIAGKAETKVGFISVPSVVKFAFMQGGGLHPFLPQYKTCALVSVDVNYTTDGQYVVTRDGYPVATELRLSFKELKLVYREDIRPVGPSTFKQGNKALHGGH